MRIELNAGGLRGLISIATFGADYNNLISKSRNVIASFKTVKQKTVCMSGGVGNLQGAVDQIDRRIKTEEAKVEKMEAVGKKFGEFLSNTVKTDKHVADIVKLNKNEFYKVNPWARPPKPASETNALKNALAWLFKKGGELVDTTRKCIDSIKSFCKEHAKAITKIVVGAVVIGGLAVLTAVTGGAAAAFFGLALKGAIVGGLTSAAVKGGMKAAGYYKEHGTLKGSGGEIFDAAAGGFMEGTITGSFSGLASGVGPMLVSSGAKASTAVAMHIFAGGISGGIGGALATAGKYVIDDGTLKGHGKEILADMAFGFVTGTITSAIETGKNHFKYRTYKNIQNKIKSNNANWLERKIATSKLTSKGFKSMINDGVWSGSKKLANHAMGKLMDKSFTTIIKSVGKKAIGKMYSNIPQMIDENFSYKLPKISNFAETTIENIGDYYKDKFVNSVPAKPLVVPFAPSAGLGNFINTGFGAGGTGRGMGSRSSIVVAGGGGGSW